MRIGYYKLTRPKEQADDWIWIIDNTIQCGQEKCLLIVGIRLSALPAAETILNHDDLEPLALFPVTKSNGEIVYQQLEETMKKTGVPREIINDCGSDIKAGIDLFCGKHPETCFIYDIKHKATAISFEDEHLNINNGCHKISILKDQIIDIENAERKLNLRLNGIEYKLSLKGYNPSETKIFFEKIKRNKTDKFDPLTTRFPRT